MIIVHVSEDPFREGSWETHEVEDLRAFLVGRFPTWPETARIYHRQIAEDCDVTPHDPASVARLGELQGPFWVAVSPGTGIETALIIAGVAAVAGLAMGFVLRPKIPTPAIRTSDVSSPNNSLAERKNSARLNGRVPDIFGTVRSVPDLLSQPYTVFDGGNREVEHALMCVGRGSYEIARADIRDDETPIEDIAGATVEVWAPDTSPNAGSPQIVAPEGARITDPFMWAKRCTGVNGQTLLATNAHWEKSEANGWPMCYAQYPNAIQLDPANNSVDWTDLFQAGDTLTVTSSEFSAPLEWTGQATATTLVVPLTGYGIPLPGALSIISCVANPEIEYPTPLEYAVDGSTITVTVPSDPLAPSPENPVAVRITYAPLDVNGTYTIQSVSAQTILLNNPAAVNVAWSLLQGMTDYGTPGASPPIDPILDVSSVDRWVGPFVIEVGAQGQFFANFVAPGGLYKDDGSAQHALDVGVALELTPVDGQGNETGPARVFETTLRGSSTSRSQRGTTLRTGDTDPPLAAGRYRVYGRRTTTHDYGYSGAVCDEVKWRDLYAMTAITEPDFGDVTTVRSVTYATRAASSLRERKLNLLVTRKLPRRDGAGFTTDLYPTRDAADILCAVALDPRIGNRSIAELDLDSIYGAVSECVAYFGTAEAGSFDYTVDKENISFEETVAVIAGAVFCQAYRRGPKIRLSFEKATADSTLLFNHRNKLPGSETRTVSFGNPQENDGLELQYVDPADDSIATYYLPADRSAVNPKKVETAGIRGKLHAHFHAWREWGRLQYQRIATEFEATQEADLLVRADRILVADNTRTGTQDGQVEAQGGLTLTLSQPVTWEFGKTYRIFLQLRDGTVESLPISAGVDERHVVLGQAPRLALTVDPQTWVQGATYDIVADDDPRIRAFLVTEKEPQERMTSQVRAVNYDERVYAHDRDLIDGVVDEDGNSV